MTNEFNAMTIGDLRTERFDLQAKIDEIAPNGNAAVGSLVRGMMLHWEGRLADVETELRRRGWNCN